jgi:hypothetical protein
MRTAVMLMASITVAVAADPVIARTAGSLDIALGEGVHLRFALAGERLIGLSEATVDGMPLRSPATAWRPVAAYDWGGSRPVISHDLRLRSAEVRDGSVVITADLSMTGDDAAWKRLYLVGPDLPSADADPAVVAARQRRDAALARLAPAVDTDPELAKAVQALAALPAMPAGSDAGPAANRARSEAMARRSRVDQIREKVLAAAIAGDAEAAAADLAWRSLREEVGLRRGVPYRDYHRYPILGLPAEIATPAAWIALADAAPWTPAGTLTWTVAMDRQVVAGWPWKGFRSQAVVDLEPGRQANAVRWLGGWELGGTAAGTTVIAHRFRGLGGLEQRLDAAADGSAATLFTTTEIIPGAAGGAPVIAPAVPASTAVNDRGYGLAHRVGAWIARLQRGGGAPYLDYQWRPEASFAAWPVRQGTLRAVTECLPGDRVVSQTDEELFAPGRRLATTPMRYLALVGGQGPEAARTRWREVEAQARAEAAQELGFVEQPVEPAVGWNIDHNFGGFAKAMAAQAGRYRELGVRMVLQHHPGWINGRALRQGAEDGVRYAGGGDCAIYDWTPLAESRDAWQAYQRSFAASGIASYAWIGNYHVRDSPASRLAGVEPERYAVRYDGLVEHGDMVQHDALDPAIQGSVDRRLEESRTRFGFQGFWIDSFQSSGHFRFRRDGTPLSRPYWEHLAGWSRKGVGIMAESHAVPGLSCSIEVGDDRRPGTWWALPMTVAWFRGSIMNTRPKEENDLVAFRLSAGGSWAAPEVRDRDPESVIPSFGRLARERNAAADRMCRPYLLPDDRGMLWLGPDDTAGVLFPLADRPVPAGVEATPVLGGPVAATATAGTAWSVRGPDLLGAFAVAKPPLPDERRARPMLRPTYDWPVR